MKNPAGTVLRIQKTSIHDGEGLRTVVFLKGCPMRCIWCSTPESQNREIEFGYGSVMTAQEVIAEISKDEVFYFHSGGGVTISGGEPITQADFTAAILYESKKRAINTAIETGMYGGFDELRKILPYLDVLYADIKHIDSDTHKRLTGAGNELILENIKSAADIFGGSVIIRVPLVPTLNMTRENAGGIAEFCMSAGNISEIQLLPYHRLGIDTYRALNRNYEIFETKIPNNEEKEAFASIMRAIATEIRIVTY